jgi:hypothetical protein
MPHADGSDLPAPGSKVRTVRHGRTVTAVVMPYDESYCRHHRSVPIKCCCGCHLYFASAPVSDLTYLGTGPPS